MMPREDFWAAMNGSAHSLLSCLEAAKSENQIQKVRGKGIHGMP